MPYIWQLLKNGLGKISWNRGIINNDCTVNSFIYLYFFIYIILFKESLAKCLHMSKHKYMY